MCSMNTGGLLQSLLLHCSVIAVISVCVCICPLGTSCSVLHRWLPYDVRIGGGSANSSWGNASSLIRVSHKTHWLLSHIRQCILWQRAVVCSQSVCLLLSSYQQQTMKMYSAVFKRSWQLCRWMPLTILYIRMLLVCTFLAYPHRVKSITYLYVCV